MTNAITYFYKLLMKVSSMSFEDCIYNQHFIMSGFEPLSEPGCKSSLPCSVVVYMDGFVSTHLYRMTILDVCVCVCV